MIRLVLAFLLAVTATPAFAAKDTVAVYFPLDQYILTAHAKDLIDDAIYQGVLSGTQSFEIIGYTDELGGASYNLVLSRKRANTVKQYLVQSGFNTDQITLIMGKGATEARPAPGRDGRQDDRRVYIVPLAGAAKTASSQAEKYNWTPSHAKSPGIKVATRDLREMQEGQTLVLDKIYFYAGRHFWRTESGAALDTLYDALARFPEIRIRIEGHVCCVSAGVPDAVDDDTHQMDLSVNRARAIRDYLISRGIQPARLEFTGFGHQHPIVMPELTEEIADRNRRVEIRIIR